MPAVLMQHDEDPAQVIFKKLGMKNGKIPGYENAIFGARVLLALYIRPEKTKGNILLTDQTRGEEKYQGKAALVVAMGPNAFKSDENYDFHGQTLKIGDWVAMWVTDGRAMMVHGVDCRVLRDQNIVMKIPSPDDVY